MSGSGRRGRRGGRRQRRHDQQAAPARAAQTNGQAGPVQPAVPERPAAAPVVPAHPRPMSARELVARLEAKRALEEGAAAVSPGEAVPATEGSVATPGSAADPAVPDVAASPRRFTARGQDWLAYVAGRGTGGVGRVAVARIGAIRFSPADDPERVAAEVIAPHARLHDLYDDELAELLERGLRWTKGND